MHYFVTYVVSSDSQLIHQGADTGLGKDQELWDA